jgi:hypothetical protein
MILAVDCLWTSNNSSHFVDIFVTNLFRYPNYDPN